MLKLIRMVDRLSTFVGQAFAWLIVVLTVHICWEVSARYIFNTPSAWAFDLQLMYYGILFMMAGAYTAFVQKSRWIMLSDKWSRTHIASGESPG